MNVTEYTQQINAINPYLSLLIFAILMLSILAMYCLPSIIAIMRQHPQKWLLVALNVFAGWTGLFWIGLLIWSLWPRDRLVSAHDGQNWGPYEDRSQSLGHAGVARPEQTLEQLCQMKERGDLTEAEFAQAKQRIIDRL